MSSIISSIDNYNPLKIGKNGCIEYSWSKNIREQICQLNFQLIRTNNITNLSLKIDNILTEIISLYKSFIISREEYLDFMSIMYRLIFYTRDIIFGKGEYKLSFVLLENWYNHFPDLAKNALKLFFISPCHNLNFHPFGSWKDIKYLHSYLNDNLDKNDNEIHPLIKFGLEQILEQLRNDFISKKPSLLCKWIPRENTKYNHLFTFLAISYFNKYIISAKNEKSKKMAIKKAKMCFRRIISCINKKLDTVQIKQCENKWSEISFEKLTSISLQKQKYSLLNINRKSNLDLKDRIVCSSLFNEFLNNNQQINSKFISLNNFTNEAKKLFLKKESDEAKILNLQWNNNSKNNKALGNIIGIIDTSENLEADALNTAISLGIRISEKSYFKNRLITFSNNCSWINLENCNNFIEKVEYVIKESTFGLNSNISCIFKTILDSIIKQKLEPEFVENMVLIFLSNMQFDPIDPKYKSIIEYIDNLYYETGKQIWNIPFKRPHIIFWNLSSTSTFPALSINDNCSMVSGFNSNILNHFTNNNYDINKNNINNNNNEIKNCSPWANLLKTLDNERYKFIDIFMREQL
uniref:DUF7788 domain-containing protein n=1 Tax=viral metagenome TaxID=1070528 RepID=A0A6C0KQ40_9ZZZZ